MLRFCQAGNECSLYFIASLIRDLLVKAVYTSYCLMLSLPVFLKCFSIFAEFQSHVSYKKCVFLKTKSL